jgi:FkbM family methyltransferase
LDDRTTAVSIGGVTFSVSGRDSDPYFVNIQDAVAQNEMLLLAIRRLRPDARILDVGANIGTTVAIAGLSLSDSRIVAVEPSPVARGHLQKTVALNGLSDRVQIVPACVGATNGEAKFFEADFLAGSHLVLSGETTHAANIAVQVPMKSIDQIVTDANLDRLDFIKIDIEGFELGALKGATKTIARFEPLILMEFNSFCLTAFGDTSPRSLLDYVRTNFGGCECLGSTGKLELLASQDEYLAFLHRNMTLRGCVDDILFRTGQGR